jgi:hypothetical protein
MGTCNVIFVVSGKSHYPQPTRTALLLIAIEFPGYLGLFELY